ncbi:MAG: methyl-accepting chemotaxis protein [Synergistaceae bacterium]|jgi:methyl-accepting chemotaxis protein|nr:methyl-accepting chemotaxis protein [Synergistaceae bacterium]
MQWFRDIRTTSKILLLVAVMVVLLIVISAAGYNTGSTIARDMEHLFRDNAMPAIWMEEMKGNTIQNRRLLLSMLNAIEMSEMESYDSRIKENRKRIHELFALYGDTIQTDEEKAIMPKIKAGIINVEKLQDEIIDTMIKSGVDERLSMRMRTGGDVAVASNESIELIEKLVALLVKQAEDVSSKSSITASASLLSIAVLSIVSVVLGLVLGLSISKMITGPIIRIEKSIKTFAEGDLTSSFPTTGKDELARMGRALGDMAETLEKIIGSVKTASQHIDVSAEEFSALAQETNATMEEFKSSVDNMGSDLNGLAATGQQINASVEEVAAGAQLMAEKGTDIARQVDEAMKAGESGMNAVHKAVGGIGGVVKNATEAVQSVQELSGRTRQIQSFVSQIGGIADQTNLLALNAAIEAARAGDAGRGFAVVAEEVRKLAEDSNVAAKNIADLAGTISGDLDHMVAISLDNAKASQEAQNLSNEIEQIISHMIAYLKSIAGSTQDLASVSEEQAASSEEISEAVQNISGKVVNTAEGGEHIRSGVSSVASSAERMAARSEELANLSAELKDILTFFKLGKDTDEPSAKLKAIPPGKSAK